MECHTSIYYEIPPFSKCVNTFLCLKKNKKNFSLYQCQKFYRYNIKIVCNLFRPL